MFAGSVGRRRVRVGRCVALDIVLNGGVFELRRLIRRQGDTVPKLAGTLQGCDADVGPDSLQVGLTIRGARSLVVLVRGRLLCLSLGNHRRFLDRTRIRYLCGVNRSERQDGQEREGQQTWVRFHPRSLNSTLARAKRPHYSPNLRRFLRSFGRVRQRGIEVKHGGRPCKKILVVRRIVSSLIWRVACECPNGVQRRPPTQCHNFTAIRVEIPHGDDGTKISGRGPIACHTGRADVLYIGGFLWPPNLSAPFSKYRHWCSPLKSSSPMLH